MGDALTAFEKSAPTHTSQGTQVEQARAIAEVRAAVMIAMDRPRHVSSAIREMREVCGITQLAERAFFRVSRGGGMVDGDSIHLARELARCWGNIDYGVKELVRDDARKQSEMLAFAWDLQTNARSEITFIIPHERHTRTGAKQLTGTQEIYENNASFAGRRLREVIFAVLPVWFRAEAAEICRKTLEQGGGKPLIQRIADLLTAFEKIGVSKAQVETKRGRKTEDFLAEDVAALGVVYTSIKRSEVSREDEFPPEEVKLPANADGFEAAAAGNHRDAKQSAPSLNDIIMLIEACENQAALDRVIQAPSTREFVGSASAEDAKRLNVAIKAQQRGFKGTTSDPTSDATLDQITAGYGDGRIMAG